MDPVVRLNPDSKPWRVFLDTDAANEIDDQFAIAHAALSPRHIQLVALGAAPFRREGLSVQESMEASLDEICRVVSLIPSSDPPIYAGAHRFLGSSDDAVESPASDQIIELALAEESPLLVVSVGAAINVASALNMEPSLVGRMGVVWLGGHSLDWSDAKEYNLMGDPYAARVLLDSGVDLMVVPALGVSNSLLVTASELDQRLTPGGALGEYLAEIVREYNADHEIERKELWDVATTAWAIDPSWVPTRVVPSPILTESFVYEHRPDRHPVRFAVEARRDPIFDDLFRKIVSNR